MLIGMAIFVGNGNISWILAIYFHLQKSLLNNWLRSAILFRAVSGGAMVCVCEFLAEDWFRCMDIVFHDELRGTDW